ncbi:mitochondrial genome maintenance protein MGM101 [Aspergillus udagawae]|nr:mitochondrial genome maintenance protein MGM101 [Aspergillus udagawae]
MASSHIRRSLRLVETTNFTKVPSRLTSRSTTQHILALTRSITTTASYKSVTTNNHQAARTAPKPPIPSTSTLPTKPSNPSSTAPAPATDDRTARILAPTPAHQTTTNIFKTGLADAPLSPDSPPEEKIDWTRSFHGLSAAPFPKEVADILLAEVDPEEVEIKPDGILYLPEIKYRRILNRAFGPGGWGLVPRSESIVTPRTVTREYALVCNGRLVSVARGEQDYFTPDGIPTATEGCRSNALVRCCKDLGIASELWDPRWIRKFKAQYTREVFVEHVVNKKRTKIWVRKDDQVSYPWKETGTK